MRAANPRSSIRPPRPAVRSTVVTALAFLLLFAGSLSAAEPAAPKPKKTKPQFTKDLGVQKTAWGVYRVLLGLRPAKTQKPVHPRALRDAGIQGSVMLVVLIDETGTPEKVGIYQSSGHTELDASAATAINGWRYIVWLEEDKPAKVVVFQTIEFNLGI